MKLLVAALLLTFATVAGAATIRLADGRTFTEARIISASPGRVCIRHAGGLVQVERTLLPPELAEKYPADPQAIAAEDAERAADAERQAARDEQRFERAREQRRLAPPPPPEPVAPSPAEIRETAERYARDYFLNRYPGGSNDALTLRVSVDTEDPEPMSGWPNQWRVAGDAAFTHYRSAGWGSYQQNSRRFEAVVYAPPGATPKVKDFTLR